ncbi:hypothetical protein AKJ66_02650 [candidate division MSBL1 archaeon SCGC-AAA259E22]|uniref:Uncharacterized protein n=1 Tax=candidate division MSBL1 archaeon SCGC-AAA259E22 TaxID=1698265 RepID=A0A133UG44_9EURY|nr:hypothetical protein AKJ66_02650 [candidate division MSBL1 archaeon SCGC-AAA259E22]
MPREKWQLKDALDGRIFFSLTAARIERWIEEGRFGGTIRSGASGSQNGRGSARLTGSNRASRTGEPISSKKRETGRKSPPFPLTNQKAFSCIFFFIIPPPVSLNGWAADG